MMVPVGRIDEQFHALAGFGGDIEFSTAVLQFALLHLPVVLCIESDLFDFALQCIKRKPLVLRSGGTRLAWAAGLGGAANPTIASAIATTEIFAKGAIPSVRAAILDGVILAFFGSSSGGSAAPRGGHGGTLPERP